VYLVAVTRWGAPFESELPALAQQLACVAYDLRLRLAGPVPVTFHTCAEQAQALAHLAFLRGRGHGAVTCLLDEVPGPNLQIVPREFELGATALSGTDDRGRPFQVAYSDIRALVRVSCVSNAVSSQTTTEKKFDMGRALISGGLMMRKSVEKTTSEASSSQQQMLYLYRASTPEPLVWKELSLRYQGLGAEMKASSMLSFARLVELLRTQAPAALYDQRLLTQKRKQSVSTFVGTDKDRRVEQSNERDNALAAYLLALAQRQAQI
jgi:hypothetical protein